MFSISALEGNATRRDIITAPGWISPGQQN